MKNIIIITGASSGIGQEFALQMDTAFSNIDEFWLIARREDRLLEVAQVMEHATRLITMDVTDEYAMDDFEKLLEESDVTVRMLINAAGFGLLGAFEDIPLEEQTEMLFVNCEALTKMTYITLPYMARGSRIIQMASSAAFLPQPDFAVYAATKAYVLSFSMALREELKKKGLWFVCADMNGTVMYDLDLKGPIGLVIGSEGDGVGRLIRERCDLTAAIPMKGNIDSLNASVAAGVLAYEIVRQRNAFISVSLK